MTLIERIHQEINSYKNLKDGWDGDDSFRPSDETIHNAITGETIVRDITEEELAQANLDKAEAKIQKKKLNNQVK